MSNNWNDPQPSQGDAGNDNQGAWGADQVGGNYDAGQTGPGQPDAQQGGWDSGASSSSSGWDQSDAGTQQGAWNQGDTASQPGSWDQPTGAQSQGGGWDQNQSAAPQWDANQQPGWDAGQAGAAYGAAGGYGAMPPAGAGVGPGGRPLASWGKRALGALIDIVLPMIVLSIIWSRVFPTQFDVSNNRVNYQQQGPSALLTWLILGLLLAALNGKTGMTPGRKVAKTQLVGEDGVPLGFGKNFLRTFAHIIDQFICCIGFLFPLWDKNRQTLADKIVKSYVVDVSTGAPLPPRP